MSDSAGKTFRKRCCTQRRLELQGVVVEALFKDNAGLLTLKNSLGITNVVLPIRWGNSQNSNIGDALKRILKGDNVQYDQGRSCSDKFAEPLLI